MTKRDITGKDGGGNRKAARILVEILILILILAATVWGRAYHSQRKFYLEGERAFMEQNYKEAITGYEWAIRMYTPFSTMVEDSCRKLWLIAEEYEKRGKLDWALIAYRSLRSSIYAIRSFYRPYGEWIPKTEARIRRILEIQETRRKGKTVR